MSNIIEEFTIGRNINFKSAEASAEKTLEVIDLVEGGANLREEDKKIKNRFWSHKGQSGLFSGEPESPEKTDLTEKFLQFCEISKEDAFRWLIARTLWLFEIPNGNESEVNELARNENIYFDFFQLISKLTIHLQERKNKKRHLFYDEILELLKEDENWNKKPIELYEEVLKLREKGKLNTIENKKSPLSIEEDLKEKGYNISRDHLNTVFVKSLNQTGFFSQIKNGRSRVGMALKKNLKGVLAERFRFMLDNPISWDSDEESWNEYLEYRGEGSDFPFEAAEGFQVSPVVSDSNVNSLVERATLDFKQSGFVVEEELVTRFAASLLTKPFIILTGLSGSGKTKLAQLFASWLTPERDSSYHEIVAVGADWTSGDDLLGYPDALSDEGYVRTSALDLLLQAHESFYGGGPTLPFFLILDEMNLSHVERYFSDFLSAIESGEEIELHGGAVERDGVPGKMEIPPNLFIVGTVNVDETTYTFSPKVLDRANSIEFRASEDAMDEFLDDPAPIDEESLRAKGRDFAEPFVQRAQTDPPDLVGDSDGGYNDADRVKEELMALFKSLRSDETGFAFRVGKEITHFIRYHRLLSPEGSSWQLTEAVDAQILQKVLPKFNGSRGQLEPPLCSLSVLCTNPRPWRTEDGSEDDDLQGLEELVSMARETTERRDEEYPIEEYPVDGDDSLRTEIGEARYPLSYEKIVRMLGRLDRNGFANFAEA